MGGLHSPAVAMCIKSVSYLEVAPDWRKNGWQQFARPIPATLMHFTVTRFTAADDGAIFICD